MCSSLQLVLLVGFAAIFTCCATFTDGVTTNCSDSDCEDDAVAAACPPDSMPDPAAPEGGCVCTNKCPPPPSCTPPDTRHLQRPATGEPSNCCDLYECISPPELNCSQVTCPIPVDKGACPPDSYRLPAHSSPQDCCSVPQECQCLPEPCRPADCKSPFWPKVEKPGNGKPGSCCPLYKCVENESNKTCSKDGKVYEDGETWRKSGCTLCSCKNGLIMCDSDPPCQQIPEGCSKTRVPKGKCCPICLEKTEPTPKGCITGTGEIIANGESWQEDPCTSCTCLEGKKRCQVSVCEACPNPKYVPNECCPLCDASSVVTLPPHCPALTNCSLRCVHGFVRDSAGCFTCHCQQDECVLQCPQGYAEDKHGNKLCECSQLSSCPNMTNCKKTCLHGYRTNKAGCPVCKCDTCKPLTGCSKKCPHGLMTSSNGCPTCRCSPAGGDERTINTSVSTKEEKSCVTEGGTIRDDGEMWFDGCRQCYCLSGVEMSSPLLCPNINCWTQVLNTSGCCPICPGPHDTTIKKHMVCGGDGAGSFHFEGETWRLGADIECVCQGGRTLCHAPECPPAPCDSQSLQTSSVGCPDCSLQLLNSSFQLSSSCESHIGETVWRESKCVSCLCDGGQSVCFEEVCKTSSCQHPLHLKGHCCPICLDDLNKGNKPSLHEQETTELTSERPNSACIVEEDNTTSLYNAGDKWKVNDCVTCQCIGVGQTLCTKEICTFTCLNAIKTPGVCCQTCLNNSDGISGDGGQGTAYIVIVSVVVCTMFIVIYLIARQCRLRRQVKLSGYGCPPPQYHQYKFVPSFEAPQSQSIRTTTEKSALSPV